MSDLVAIEARTAVLEHEIVSRLATLETRVGVLERDAASHRTAQDARHTENGVRLGAIEKSLTEIAVYLKIGRWVMHAISAIVGAVAAAAMIKWFAKA